MKILEEYNMLKLENEGKIVLMKIGAFYTALGIDAYILSDILELKLSNFSSSKKVGIPVNSKLKYINIMQNYDIPYVFVEYGKVIYSFEGNFDFVEKTEKFRALYNLFLVKDKVLKIMYKYCSKDLGEVL